MTKEGVFRFTFNNLMKCESKSCFDYIKNNYQMTHKTIDLGFDHLTNKSLDMSEDIQTQSESVSKRKHLKILKKLGSGAFGQVFKVEHLLVQQFYALKRINLPGI